VQSAPITNKAESSNIGHGGCFLRVLWFPPPIKLNATIKTGGELKTALNTRHRTKINKTKAAQKTEMMRNTDPTKKRFITHLA
jgi:hypothetical protein